MFPCYGMWFRINTCSESVLVMYIWTSWFAHFLRQTKLEEDYPPIERERERESIWNLSFRYKSEAFSITKGQRVFSFFLLLWHRNTSFLLHYEHLGNLFYWNGNWTTKSFCGAIMSSWHAAMGCDWIFKTLLLWMEKNRMRSSVQKPWTLFCLLGKTYKRQTKSDLKISSKFDWGHWCGDGFFDSFVI